MPTEKKPAKSVVRFQPIVNIHTGMCLGVEAVDSGSEDPLNTLRFEQIIAGFSQIRFGQSGLFVNVNPAALTLDFPRKAAESLAKYNLTPTQISFEVSEIRDNVPDMQVIALLKAAGFEIGLADFGSGFSRLQSLYEIQPNFVKLNQALLEDIDSDARKRHFVSHLINLAHLFGARVIAQGIQNEAKFYQCRSLGCDMAQGDLIDKPSTGYAIPQQGYESIMMLGIRDRRGRDDARKIVADSIEQIAPLCETMDMGVVFDMVRANKQNSCFPVVNAQEKPLGVIRESRMKDYAYSEFGRSVLLKRTLSDVLKKFLTPCPIADVNSDLETILELHAADASNQGLILVDDNKYAGYLSAGALVRIMHERSLSIARDCNPLTKLAGNYLIYEYLSGALRDIDNDYILVYLDIDHFKPFNDKNGFRSGDRVLVLLAEMLRKEFQKQNSFVGHIGGDDFFVGIKNVSMDKVREDIVKLAQKFSRDVLPFYNLEDLQNGYILCADRDGRPSRFPLATVSAALLKVGKGCDRPEIDGVGAIIAELKKSSKASPQKLASGISGRHHILIQAPAEQNAVQ